MRQQTVRPDRLLGLARQFRAKPISFQRFVRSNCKLRIGILGERCERKKRPEMNSQMGSRIPDVFCSADFQTCRLADSLKSAGREAAPAVGLETCAARVRATRSYSQFEAVIRYVLPTVNLARETGNY